MTKATPSSRVAHSATHYWPWVSAAVCVAVAVALGLVILLRDNEPFLLDGLWLDVAVRNRATWLGVPALILNFVGGGWFAIVLVPLGIIAGLLLVKRPWSALYYALAALTSVVVVQVLKAAFGRQRPEEILVTSDAGSFPSGHVANATTIAVVVALIFARTWVWYAGALYAVVMALSRTYLGAHWLSDTIGGALIGAGIAVIVWAPFAKRLDRERNPPCAAKVEPVG